jgi:hypothetical protein
MADEAVLNRIPTKKTQNPKNPPVKINKDFTILQQ